MRRLLLVLPLVVALPGCSGGGSESKPVTLPPLKAAPSTSATPSPTVAPVKKPAKADEPSREGAETFAKYWVAVVNRSYATLDSHELRKLGTNRCQTCRNYLQSLRKSADAGEVYEGGRFEILSAIAPPISGDKARVLLDYKAPELIVRDGTGRVVHKAPATKRATLVFDLVRVRDSWRAEEVASFEPTDSNA